MAAGVTKNSIASGKGTSKRVLEHWRQSVRLTVSPSVRQAGRQWGRQACGQKHPVWVLFGGSLHLQAMANRICEGKDSGLVDEQPADGQISVGSNPVLDI